MPCDGSCSRVHPLLLPCQMQQLLSAVSHLHGRGLFHRDIKPENLLIRGADCEAEAETGTEAAAALPVLKLADFGQAKPIRSVPPFTEYVSTRWYRAPELLLRSASYSSPVDVWAAGCVLAELLTLQPLFPGTGEVDVLRRIAACIGPPSASCWPDGAALVAKAGLTFAAAAATDSLQQLLRARCPTVSDEAVALLSALLCWDPRRRVSARQALQHPYFTARQGREEGEEEGSSAEGGVDEVEAELRLLDSASNEPSIRPSAASPPRSLSERRQSGAADRMGDGRWRQGACAASAAAVERVEPPALQPAAPPSRPASAALRPSSARPPLLPTAVGAAVNLSFSSLSASRPSSVQSSRETAEQRHSRFVHAANAMMR